MKKRVVAIFLLMILVLTGCGSSAASVVADQYPLKDTVKSSVDSEDTAQVYVAKGESIQEVAQFLQKKKEPNRVSDRKEGKQVLVYDDYFVTLMESKDNPENTDIEVASYTFVRDNYRPSFFEGLLAGALLSRLFNTPRWGSTQSLRCQRSVNPCYGGYVSSGGRYKGPSTVPSFRGSLSGFRGGGPNAGK